MNDCSYYEDLCSAYLDAELDAAERTALEAHCAACPACASFLEQLREMQRMLAAEQIPLPSSLHESVMELVLAEAQAEPVVTKRRLIPAFSLLAAAAAAVMLVTTGTIGDLFNSSRAAVGGNMASVAPQQATIAATGGAPVAANESAEAPSAVFSEGVDAALENDEAELPPEAADASGAKAIPPDEGNAAAVFDAPPVGQEEGVSAQQDAGTAPEAPSGRMVMSAPVDELIVLPPMPASLEGQRYARCYVAVGTGKLPEFEGVLVAESDDETVYYFTIKNNTSVLEKAMAVLFGAGYEYERRETVEGLTFDEKAEDALVIVLKN